MVLVYEASSVYAAVHNPQTTAMLPQAGFRILHHAVPHAWCLWTWAAANVGADVESQDMQ